MRTLTRSALGAATALGAIAIGCGVDEEPAQPRSGALVVFERSGGIAGTAERLVIEPNGSATLTVGLGIRGEREREFELSDERLETLGDELEAAELEAVEPAPPNSICADCFSYGVTYAGATTDWDDVAELPGSVETLSAHLTELVSAHYPPGIERIESNS